MQQIDIAAYCIILFIQFLRQFIFARRILYCKVVFDSFNGRVADESIEVFIIRENAIVIQSIDISIIIAFILCLDSLIECRQSISWYTLCIQRNQDFSYLTVYFMIIILVVYIGICFFQAADSFFDIFLFVLLQSSFQIVEQNVCSAKLDTASESFTEVNHLLGNRSSLLNILVNLAYNLSIVGIVLFFCKLCKLSFLFSLCFQYFIVDDSLVHTDRVFPVVAGRSELTCILDTYLIAGSHFLTQYVLTCFTNFNTRSVYSFHTHFHFTFSQVTAGASRESHNHSIVAFLQTFQRNSKMLLHFQRNIVGTIFSRVTIFIGIDTEHREVTCMTRPHPVVCFSTEFTD